MVKFRKAYKKQTLNKLNQYSRVSVRIQEKSKVGSLRSTVRFKNVIIALRIVPK